MADHCGLCIKGFPKRDDGMHYGTQSLGMIPNSPCVEEYLRRNLNVAKAAGAAAGARAILNRLAVRKRNPQWLVAAVNGIYSRTKPLSRELAAYRDEVRSPSTNGSKR